LWWLVLLFLVVGVPFVAVPLFLLYVAVWGEDAEEWLEQLKD